MKTDISTKKIAVFSLGCKVNQYEGQAMVSRLIEHGYSACDSLEKADCYIINTCSVTAEADKKSRQAVARVLKLNPDADVYVCGCSSQNDFTNYEKKQNVKYISGVGGKNNFLTKVLNDLENHDNSPCKSSVLPLPKIYEDNLSPRLSRARGYIKIQDGCDNFCSYCIVPYLRGRSRSRSIDSIVKEAKSMTELSREIVLTGINISAYGKDTGNELIGLVEALEGLNCRFRFGSLECNVITEPLLLAMKRSNFAEHFHLSLQSACDSVLKKMNRKYTVEQYAEKVKLIREFFPFAGITTDIIAGFPEETLSEHNKTLENIQLINFSDMHVFAYSERKGTVAAKMRQTDIGERARRAAEISAVRDKMCLEFLSAQVGKTLQVYPEENWENGTVGHSRNFVKVYSSAKKGMLNDVKITALYKDGVKGEIEL